MAVTLNEDGKTELQGLKDALLPKYHQYIKVFAPETAKAVPEHRQWDHAIDLFEGAKPPWGPIYALSEAKLKALREYLDKMILQGKIWPSKTPAEAPILFVPKPQGQGL